MFSIKFANTALKKNKLEENWIIWEEAELLDKKIIAQGLRTAGGIMQKTKPVSWS